MSANNDEPKFVEIDLNSPIHSDKTTSMSDVNRVDGESGKIMRTRWLCTTNKWLLGTTVVCAIAVICVITTSNLYIKKPDQVSPVGNFSTAMFNLPTIASRNESRTLMTTIEMASNYSISTISSLGTNAESFETVVKIVINSTITTSAQSITVTRSPNPTLTNSTK